MRVRHPTQAGLFYAGTRASLIKEVEDSFLHRFGPGKLPKVAEEGARLIVAVVCPHAGYMYSGAVAANSYYSLALDGKLDTAVVIGPNHTGVGSGVSIMVEGRWLTPLGEVEVNSELAEEIRGNAKIIDVDDQAHLYEHSIEVQLPFLQYIYGDRFNFVPITMLMQDLATSIEVGEAVAKSLAGRNAVVVASSDMTHYEPQKSAEKKDRLAIDAVLKTNEAELQRVVEEEGISMCGCGPVTSAVRASKILGAKKAELLSYKTSGDITGDLGAVVGYASIVLRK